MALFGRTFDKAAKARIAQYEAELQAKASDENWLDLEALEDTEFETVVQSGKFDSKGRSVDFIIGAKEVDGKFYGWVQAARNGKDFGTSQRSKEYASLEAAKVATQRIAKERIANLK